ncbi:MAG TPA: DUF2470 domain-containing protein [Candidatus Xenobia bacterium]
MSSQDHDRPTGGLSPVILQPGLNHAEWSRTIAEMALYGTMGTITQDPPGYPYGSLAHFALDDDNAPIFLISRLAEHTINLEADPRSSLLVAETSPDFNPLARGRVTLLGRTTPVDRSLVRDRYLARIPQARYYVDFRDFVFYRMEVEAIRFIGGFGRMSWVDAPAWKTAVPDPIVPHAPGILQHMNDDHGEALVLMCRHLARLAEVTKARMTEVDRYGFEIQAEETAGPRLVRLGFRSPLASADGVRPAMIELVEEARRAVR